MQAPEFQIYQYTYSNTPYPELVRAAFGLLKQESRGTFFQKFITTPSENNLNKIHQFSKLACVKMKKSKK